MLAGLQCGSLGQRRLTTLSKLAMVAPLFSGENCGMMSAPIVCLYQWGWEARCSDLWTTPSGQLMRIDVDNCGLQAAVLDKLLADTSVASLHGGGLGKGVSIKASLASACKWRESGEYTKLCVLETFVCAGTTTGVKRQALM